MKKRTSPKLRGLAGSTVAGVDVALPDDDPFMVSVTAVVQLASGGLWRPTCHELNETFSALEREVTKGKPWAPPVRDLVVSHIQAMDEMLLRDPMKTLHEELKARADLRMLARQLQNHFQRHTMLPLKEVLQIVNVRRIYHEAIVDDVHSA